MNGVNSSGGIMRSMAKGLHSFLSSLTKCFGSFKGLRKASPKETAFVKSQISESKAETKSKVADLNLRISARNASSKEGPSSLTSNDVLKEVLSADIPEVTNTIKKNHNEAELNIFTDIQSARKEGLTPKSVGRLLTSFTAKEANAFGSGESYVFNFGEGTSGVSSSEEFIALAQSKIDAGDLDGAMTMIENEVVLALKTSVNSELLSAIGLESKTPRSFEL